MIIRTANDQSVVRQAGGYRRFVAQMIVKVWGQTLRIHWDDTHGEVMAEVVRSSWRVMCPFCPGGLWAEPPTSDLPDGEPFFCVDCLMQANAFRPMRVIWPVDRLQIERVLLLRPDPLTRNWLPGRGETLEVLQFENKQHGHRVR